MRMFVIPYYDGEEWDCDREQSQEREATGEQLTGLRARIYRA